MQDHPIQLSFPTGRERSRLELILRMFKLIPHSVWLMLYSIPASFVLMYHFFGTLFSGVGPANSHGYLVRWLNYNTRVSAYSVLLSDTYPPFNGVDEYDVNMHIGDPEPQGRMGVFFRGILMIPSMFVIFFMMIAFGITNWLGNAAVLFTGTLPEFAQEYGQKFMRYQVRMSCYGMWLTSAKPDSTVGTPGLGTPLSSSHMDTPVAV